MAIVAEYTLAILNEIKQGEKILPQEWHYLISAPVEYLNEMLAYSGFGFTPPRSLGNFEITKKTSELNWQLRRAVSALELMGILNSSQSPDKYRRGVIKHLVLFLFIVRKMHKERHIPFSVKHRRIFERYRIFLGHLLYAVCGYRSREKR